MKKPLFGIVLLLSLLGTLNSKFAHAQRINYFKLPAGNDISKVPWRQSIYRFQEFQKGKITYSNEFQLDYEFDLNYNIYFERMDFIDSSGDTLCITNTREIKSIQIGDKTFFHEDGSGYYEVLLHLPIALAFRNEFVLEQLEFINGSKLWESPTDLRGSIADYARIYRKAFSYFFIDQNNKIHQATRASVLKLFPTHSTEIKGYLLEHRVDFDSREDLMDLINYCNQFTHSPEGENNPGSHSLTLRLPAGKRIPSKKAMDTLYRFPEFYEAKVIWANQSSSFHSDKMNYNTFFGTMDVIDEKGDTIKFTRWHESKFVNLDGDVFFQDVENGYLEILLHGDLALAVRSKFILVTDKGMLEASGLTDQANASDHSNRKPVANYDRLYKLQRTYFFINRDQAYEANKFSILKLMRNHSDALIEYFNQKNISLSDEQQLRELTAYCNRLLAKS